MTVTIGGNKLATLNNNGIIPDTQLPSRLRVTAPAAATIESVTLPKATGFASVGSSTTASASDHIHPRADFIPGDFGLISWAFDPATSVNSFKPNVGQLQLIRLHVPAATTITNVCVGIVTAGVTLTSGQNFAGLYNASHALLSGTADQTTNWASAGFKVMALTSAQSVTAGDYFVGFYVNGMTAPYFASASSNFMANLGTYNNGARYAHADTGLTTTLPATTATFATDNVAVWAALS